MHRVHVELDPAYAVVAADGELDAYAAPDLERAFASTSTAGRVIVNLEPVSFLDSTALGLVVRGLREIAERGADARVVLPLGAARRIFEITTLDRALPIASSLEAAIAELRG